jgi:predicted ATPase/DNA-binding XRE family transcriptional regulator
LYDVHRRNCAVVESYEVNDTGATAEVKAVENETAGGSAFGALLRRHRLAAGLSQEVLAERARMSVSAVSALERGNRRSPYRETVILLAKALDLAPIAAAELHAAAARPQQPRKSTQLQPERPVSRTYETNLPCPRTSLIGRANEIADLTGIIAENRLVTITGTGGIGKTRTALAVGEALRATATAGVWLIELASVTQGSLVPAAVARTLNVQESPSHPLLETLLSYLGKKSLVLVLDNCEHVVAEAAAFADALLRRCPHLRVLATSREPLHIAGEQTYRLPSLRVPTANERAMSAAAAANYDAVRLFAQRARANDRQFRLDDDNASIAADVCRRLDGIPLAIELAAAQVKVLTLQGLATKLDRRLRLLTNGERSAMPRHQTMRALIDWSYALLPAPEQRLFERLSAFAGGCTLPLATALYCDDAIDDFGVLQLLSALVDKSLVVADLSAREPRYRLLESSREYAREKLDAHGEAEIAARRHALAYLALAEHSRDTWDTVPDRVWYPQAEAEAENWNTALDWALNRRNDVRLGQRLAAALCPYWQNFAPVEGRRWVRSAAALVDESTPGELVAQLDFAQAFIAAMFFEFKAAFAAGERALSAFRSQSDKRSTADALRIVGISLVALGRTEEGEALLSEALENARPLGQRQIVGWLAVGLGFARTARGDLAGARAAYAEALKRFQDLGADRSAAMVRLNLAGDEARAGDADAALRLANDAVATLRGLNRLHDVMNGLIELASYLIALERYGEAREAATEALDLALERRWSAGLLVSVQHLAAVAALDPLQHARADDARARAARLLGFVDTRLSAAGITRDYVEEHECDEVRAALRDHFEPHELTELLAEGAVLSQARAIELARLTLAAVEVISPAP